MSPVAWLVEDSSSSIRICYRPGFTPGSPRANRVPPSIPPTVLSGCVWCTRPSVSRKVVTFYVYVQTIRDETPFTRGTRQSTSTRGLPAPVHALRLGALPVHSHPQPSAAWLQRKRASSPRARLPIPPRSPSTAIRRLPASRPPQQLRTDNRTRGHSPRHVAGQPATLTTIPPSRPAALEPTEILPPQQIRLRMEAESTKAARDGGWRRGRKMVLLAGKAASACRPHHPTLFLSPRPRS